MLNVAGGDHAGSHLAMGGQASVGPGEARTALVGSNVWVILDRPGSWVS